MTGQAATFDKIGIPYTFDDDLGPLVAEKVPMAGDGQWMYDERLRIVPTTKAPPPIEKIARDRADRLARAKHFIEQWSFEKHVLETKRSTETANSKNEQEDNEGEEDDDDEPFVTLDQELPFTRDLDVSWWARCSVTRRPRPSTGRIDLIIVTPDGRTFRSWCSAKAHMQACAE